MTPNDSSDDGKSLNTQGFGQELKIYDRFIDQVRNFTEFSGI